MTRSKAMSNDAIVLYGAPEVDANVLYATGFHAPDPFLFLRVRGKSTVVMSDLEIDRARTEAAVDRVVSLTKTLATLRDRGVREPGIADVAALLLREARVRGVTVPSTFPVLIADELRARRVRVEPVREPFFPERTRKTADEARSILDVQRVAERALEAGLALLRRASARRGYLYLDGVVLTSERVRRAIEVSALEHECVAMNTIVAGGDQGCDPHNRGSGPLRPGETIIIDVFPRSTRTFYFGDLTRTVVKGVASDAIRGLYHAVSEAHRTGLESIRAGVDGKDVHTATAAVFERLGYPTGAKAGRMEGFFHGTGHGVGLDLHELPRVGRVGTEIPEGAVVTVEPGLYYPGVGAVRIEDLVFVEKRGVRNLTRIPKILEIG
ncbi:MAG: aminopeptidase P family protein [Planctomycetes bacterium]|nr:aminopeptidase P family protein [Planctomycetota bacterium]MBI3846044.1 aminopeptidase P family protein [Planctomycetota bacterium]